MINSVTDLFYSTFHLYDKSLEFHCDSHCMDPDVVVVDADIWEEHLVVAGHDNGLHVSQTDPAAVAVAADDLCTDQPEVLAAVVDVVAVGNIDLCPDL